MRTVQELIEALQELPQDALIGVASGHRSDGGYLFPIQIVKNGVIDRERIYCMSIGDFNQRIGYDRDFIEKWGFWLAADYEDIPQEYALCDEDGEIIKIEGEY